MTQSYELMYILRPDLLDEQVQQQINKYRDFLSDNNAEDIQIKNWGKRRLAYPIKKFQDGFYVQVNYKGDGKQIAPIERAMRLSDEVIRYLTIKLRKDQVVLTESEPSQPAIESPKPIVESPKPVTESPKPVAESPKPVEESEPVAESAEPVDESDDTVDTVDTTSEEE